MRGALLAVLLILTAFASSADAAQRKKPVEASIARIPAKILFSKARAPAELAPQSIGGYADGCLAGGDELALTDPATLPAWQVMRPSRNRNWGNPVLIDFLERFARQARDSGDWPGLLVGDLAQPRGGPMLSGHASHQIGLDADIWLTPMPARILTPKERETMVPRKVVKSHFDIDPKIWTDAHAKIISRAAKDKNVARIFVHPPIKKALCEWAGKTGDRRWLAKVRPYYGHDYHFHIRLRCPSGNKACKNQPEPNPADGTGCGAELAGWLSKDFWARRQPAAPGKPIKPAPALTLAALPAACKTVLASP